MTTTTFTTRIDTDLKTRLQKIAETDQRSASYMANEAIRLMVEDREATQKLIEFGLEDIKRGIAISEEAVDAWLDGPEDAQFPEPDVFFGNQ